MSVQRMEIDFVISSDCKLSLPLLHYTSAYTKNTKDMCIYFMPCFRSIKPRYVIPLNSDFATLHTKSIKTYQFYLFINIVIASIPMGFITNILRAPNVF